VAQAGFVGGFGAGDEQLPAGAGAGVAQLDLVALGLALVQQGLDIGQLVAAQALPGGVVVVAGGSGWGWPWVRDGLVDLLDAAVAADGDGGVDGVDGLELGELGLRVGRQGPA
jgi:hypothetical protein